MATLPRMEIDAPTLVERAQTPKAPRATPLSFGYMRLRADNPNAETYRRMLQQENPARIYADYPAKMGDFTVFDEMLGELRPNDTVILVRLDHFGEFRHTNYDAWVQLSRENVNIKLIANALQQLPATAALLQEMFRVIDPIVMADCIVKPTKGGDGGSGNGGS